MCSVGVPFRVDEELKTESASSAKALDRTGAQLLRKFIHSYVAQQQAQDHDTWLIAKVEQSRATTKACNLSPTADVEARFAARRARLAKTE